MFSKSLYINTGDNQYIYNGDREAVMAEGSDCIVTIISDTVRSIERTSEKFCVISMSLHELRHLFYLTTWLFTGNGDMLCLLNDGIKLIVWCFTPFSNIFSVILRRFQGVHLC